MNFSLQYSMIMITTIQQTLRPILIMYFIVGLSSYPTKQPTSRITCLSILYSLIIWCIYAYLYYYIVTLFTWKETFPSTIHIVYIMISNFTAIISTIMGFYYQEKLRMCIKRLAAVDDTLEQLGTPKTYGKMQMYSKQVVIGWIVFINIMNFVSLVNLPDSKLEIIWKILRVYIQNHSFNIVSFVDNLFIIFLWYIGTRFDKVNEHMQCLLSKKRISNGKKPVVALHRYVICTDDYKQMLWTLMHLHLELCRITRELNLIFGTQMTFEMASSIISMTVLCFFLNVFLMEYQEIIPLYVSLVSCFSALMLIIKLCVIHYTCECVKVKAKRIDKIFHQLTNIIRYSDIWKEIYQFILQAIHHPLKFTGMGLFYFGNDFLRKLCTTVLMYVIIMIQMKVPLF